MSNYIKKSAPAADVQGVATEILGNMVDAARDLFAYIALMPDEFDAARKHLSPKKFPAETGLSCLASAFFASDEKLGRINLTVVCSEWERMEREAGQQDSAIGAFSGRKNSRTPTALIEWAGSRSIIGLDDVGEACAVYSEHYRVYTEALLANAVLSNIARGKRGAEVMDISETNRAESGAYDTKTSDSGHQELMSHLESKLPGAKRKSGISPFLESIHDIVPIHEAGELIIIAARPGVGKSWYALNQLVHSAKKGEKGALFVVEMTELSMRRRILSMETGYSLRGADDLDKFFVDKIFRNEYFERFHKGATSLTQAEISELVAEKKAEMFAIAAAQNELDLTIEAECRTLREIANRSRELKKQQGIEYIIVDYLQKVQLDEKKQNREQEISTISWGLKSLAKELKIPVIALCQLSREVERRGGSKRGQLSDLRESGSLEQDADLVGFLHRPESMGVTEFEDGTPTKNKADFIIAKQRDGDLETFRIGFEGLKGFFDEHGPFDNPQPSPAQPGAPQPRDPSQPNESGESMFENFPATERADPDSVPF